MKSSHDDLIIVFFNVYKTCQRQIYGIETLQAESSTKYVNLKTKWQEVIMMSLPKTIEKQWENADLRQTTIFRKVLRAIQK